MIELPSVAWLAGRIPGGALLWRRLARAKPSPEAKAGPGRDRDVGAVTVAGSRGLQSWRSVAQRSGRPRSAVPVVCAWCGASLQRGSARAGSGGPVSHGICRGCARRLRQGS